MRRWHLDLTGLLSSVFEAAAAIVDPIEKALHKQRLDAVKAGQRGYLELQRKALTN